MTEESNVVYVDARKLSRMQKRRVKELQEECFSRVDRKEIEECFIAKGFGWVFACQTDSIVGQIELFARKLRFDGRTLLVGGLGGTCVTVSARRRGVGSILVKRAIEILTERKCDIACLSANIRDHPSGGLYGKLGFTLMKRPVSFTDVHGRIRYDTGEMFAPICSKQAYESVMNSGNTFHMGRGFW